MPGMPGMGGPRPNMMLGNLPLPAGFPGGPRPGEGSTGCLQDLISTSCLANSARNQQIVLCGVNLPAASQDPD
jgi:hypothetical protein